MISYSIFLHLKNHSKLGTSFARELLQQSRVLLIIGLKTIWKILLSTFSKLVDFAPKLSKVELLDIILLA